MRLQHLNLYVLCFSDDGPDTSPHRISQEELRAAFNPAMEWNVATIEPDAFRRATTTTVHRLVRDNQTR
jgi:hypothetical protein